MRILIAGSSGLIGSALVDRLSARGDKVVRLVRPSSVEKISNSSSTIIWEPERGKVSLEALEGFDAFVNLAGASIARVPFNDTHKRIIHDSRVAATSVLAHGMLRLKHRPKVFISASAVGFYGNRGDDILTEAEWPGRNFLSEVCSAWEASARPARELGVRVVHPRFGVVLSTKWGALQKMLTPFRLGLGATLGDGKQYMSWISLEDAVNGLLFAIDHDSLEGGVNFTTPNPVTNAEFTKTLARALHRPSIFRIPAPLLRLVLGELAELLLLQSTRAVPEKLLQAGFQFQDVTLEVTLARLLKTSPAS